MNYMQMTSIARRYLNHRLQVINFNKIDPIKSKQGSD